MSEAPELFVQLLVEPTFALALKLCPQSSSLIALTFRVDTPWMYISRTGKTAPMSAIR